MPKYDENYGGAKNSNATVTPDCESVENLAIHNLELGREYALTEGRGAEDAFGDGSRIEGTMFTKAFIGSAKLANGKIADVMVIFNSEDFYFEDVNVGLNAIFSRCANVKESRNVYYSIRNGILKSIARFHEIKWRRTDAK
jgi:hypothetical protein